MLVKPSATHMLGNGMVVPLENYTLALVGIAVTVVLFVVGYRKTVGARRERVRSANEAVERMLVRRVVSEEYTPRSCDIVRLVDAKSRDLGVRPSELQSEGQLLNDVFTQIVETDLLSQERREQILSRLEAALTETEGPSATDLDQSLDQLPLRRKTERAADMTSFLVSFFASVGGGVAFFLASLGTGEFDPSRNYVWVLAVVGAGLGVTLLLLAFYRLLRQRESSYEDASASSTLELERDVGRVLEKVGASVRIAGQGDKGFDLAFERAERRLLVEIKSWSRAVPYRLLGVSLARLSAAVATEGADEGILVVPNSVQSMPTPAGIERVKVMTVREFRNYVVHMPSK